MRSSREERQAILRAVSRCPVPGCHPHNADSREAAVIYRTSVRSVSMRCNRCGLLWTVTIHQLAKAMRRLLDREEAARRVVQRLREDDPAEAMRHIQDEADEGFIRFDKGDVEEIEAWAAEVPNRRGRKGQA
jgi:uncharacterized Zn finger protein